jgi:hypothetical protein
MAMPWPAVAVPTSSSNIHSPVTLPSAVYLVQGLLGLSRLAVFVFLKDTLGLAPATVALITSSGYAPWVRQAGWLAGWLASWLDLRRTCRARVIHSWPADVCGPAGRHVTVPGSSQRQ